MPIEYEVRHALPGRLRLFVPALHSVEGLSAALAERLKGQEGVTEVRVNQACASVLVRYDAGRQEIPRKLRSSLRCLSPELLLADWRTPANGASNVPAYPRGLRDLTWPTVSLAISLLKGSVSAALALVLGLYNAFPILKRAYQVVWGERRLNVDFLDSLAISISTAQGKLFTSAFMTWLIRLGDWIRDQTAAKSKRAISELLDFQGRKAWVLRGNDKVEIPVKDIAVGDTVVVYPGGLIPVDGQVLKGRATVDQKTITGESLPVVRSAGEKVYAATVLREGKLYLRASRVGADTLAAQIVHLVEQAPVGETRIQNYAEKFADKLVAPSLGLGSGLYLMTSDLDRFLSMVIIDYGTGIRVAAPTSVLACMTHAARQGILIKSGGYMEKLAKVDTIVFDKTGTLTLGEPRILEIISCDEAKFPPRAILALAAAAEARLKHPVAHAILNKAHEEKIRPPKRTGSRYRIGMGVEAQVNGNVVHVGSERFFRENKIRLEKAASYLRSLSRHGHSGLLLAVDGRLKGVIAYADQIRPESQNVIQTLHNRGVRNIMMVTGDNKTAARVVAARLGLDRFFSETLPAEKAEIVQQLQKQGHVVAMVGDGINDSVALSYADVGIALSNGADVARETASIVLMQDNLWKLISALEISREAINLIHQNFAIIAVLNTLAYALALPSGVVTPDITATISNGSAILASVNAVRPIMRY